MIPLHYISDNQEKYNFEFSYDEFTYTLNDIRGSSASPDDIHYNMLKNLPADWKLMNLDASNDRCCLM